MEYLTGARTLSSNVGLRLPVHGSLSGLCLLTGAIQLGIDGRNDARVDSAAVVATGFRSILCVPLADQLCSVAMLDRLDTPETAGLDWQQATAQFVASVMTPGLVDRVTLQHRVESVLQAAALDIIFQPVIDLQADQIVACETLSSCHSPTGESPSWWFEAANPVGLGVELELLAERRALVLMSQVPGDLGMAVNVGPETLLRAVLLDRMETADPVGKAMAMAIVSFAEAMGSRVITEGLEMREDVECLSRLGVG